MHLFIHRHPPINSAVLLRGIATVSVGFFITGALLTTPVHAKSKRKVSQNDNNAPLYEGRADAMQFADTAAKRLGIDAAWTRNAIGNAKQLSRVPQLMLPAPKGTPKNWRAYRGRFIDDARIQAGIQFWDQNATTLARAERDMGVPAAIIVGIIGVETIYGQNMGSFRVMDALSTLAFDFPQAHPRAKERQTYFQGELEQFLALTYQNKTDPFSIKGSYAGAMGLGQFMPSSWVRYAIDFDNNGKVDLFNSPADAIGSVANYFLAYGWKPAMPTHYAVDISGTTAEQLDTLLLPDILPTFSPPAFQALGAVLDDAGKKHVGSLALVELQNGQNTPTFIAGTENFYTITRYNWSSYYAMAVIELGREVAEARKGVKTP